MRITTLLIPALFLVPFTLPAQTPFPLQQYGHGGCGLGDYVPTFHTGGEFPILGNSNFQVVSENLSSPFLKYYDVCIAPRQALWHTPSWPREGIKCREEAHTSSPLPRNRGQL